MNSVQPRVKDNDINEITVTLEGKEIRGWSYRDETERRIKMKCAHEFVEGWFQCSKTRPIIKTSEETPTEPGHYWAVLRTVDNQPEGEDWISGEPEIVQVNENCLDTSSPIHLMAAVPGMTPSQSLNNFQWLSGKIASPQ